LSLNSNKSWCWI